jgi:hypothetical protein
MTEMATEVINFRHDSLDLRLDLETTKERAAHSSYFSRMAVMWQARILCHVKFCPFENERRLLQYV